MEGGTLLVVLVSEMCPEKKIIPRKGSEKNTVLLVTFIR